MVLGGDTVLGIGLADFLKTSSIVTSNSLTIASGATARFDHSSTINGPVIVNGTLTLNNASATLRINATLTLNAIGTINNSGIISAAAFVNNGGTLNGVAPVILAASPAILRIEQVRVSALPGPIFIGAGRQAITNRLLILKWHAPSGHQFSLETTTDLRNWADLPAVISESGPGAFQVTVPAQNSGSRFYRLRRL